eukprot:SAG11_NODE_6566_length_1287_cov_1.941077_1_plen_55_part_10
MPRQVADTAWQHAGQMLLRSTESPLPSSRASVDLHVELDVHKLNRTPNAQNTIEP